MREIVRSIVSDIAPLDAEESHHRADVIDWIDAGVDISPGESAASSS